MNSLQKMQLMYILPNLFTAASAFLGVISIISSIQGNYFKAIIYIILSLILDGLDGRVARLTKTTSKFGVEFDSLADLVAFGVAPAILFYLTVGAKFGRFGALIAAMFVSLWSLLDLLVLTSPPAHTSQMFSSDFLYHQQPSSECFGLVFI